MGDKRLDADQVRAVVACEDAQLVLAAAGSGKTLSLLAKIEYVHYRLGIAPQKILVISFTKKTVTELRERCDISGVEIRTFHSLGNKILSESKGFAGFSLISEPQIADFIDTYCATISLRFKKIIDEYFVGREYKERLLAFRKVLATFLLLYKSGMHDINELRARSIEDAFERERTAAFLRIFEDFYVKYQSFLRISHYYDFSDMINVAISIVRDNPKIARGYRYILLDEVQDLSKNRAFLLREILRKNPTCKFFAVGDDWQSIYRFTGSDNSLLRDFEKIFEKHTYRSYISTTHRFGEPTVSKSCEFILKNSSQFRKNVISTKKDKTNIKIIMNRPGTNNDGESVMKIISLLVEQYSYAKLCKMELQIVSRYNHDIDRLSNTKYLFLRRDAVI